jgi:hypothetical protein
LMSLVKGPAVKRQTQEALYCMQTMKNQVKIKQSFDKAKVTRSLITCNNPILIRN